MSDAEKRLEYLSPQKLALLSAKLRERAVKTQHREIDRRPNPSAPCLLSFAQRRLWFLDQLVPNNPFYNIPVTVGLEGRLDLKVLERVINEVIRRHEVLRTRIEVDEGEPVQVIDQWEPWRSEVEDLRSLTHEERQEAVARVASEEAGAGFDLSRGPLLRMKVLKLGEEEHVLFYTTHHIVSDGWSMEVMMREVSVLYEAMSEGKESPLPELEIQYADYAYWQRHYLREEVLEERLLFWKKQLAGKLSIVDLVPDYPRPLVPSYRGAAKSILLAAGLGESLKTLSRREGVTLFMVLLAAFKTLLYRCTAQEDIIVGVPAANRNRAEIEPLIGFFVNMLPMRTDLSGNPRFNELLKRVKEAALGAYAHQDLPFEKLVEEIQPGRGMGEMPLFNITFDLQKAQREDVWLNGLKVSPVAGKHESARLELSLLVTESADELSAGWVYNTDLFKEETIVRMHGHFETLLSSIAARPDAMLDELEVLGETERAQHAISRAVREEHNYSRFKSLKPRIVALSED
jgi:Condensation domain